MSETRKRNFSAIVLAGTSLAIRERRPRRSAIFFLMGLAIAAAIVTRFSAVADAHSYKLGDLAIGHIWAPPPESGASGVAVYGPFFNRGSTTVRLVNASTTIAETVRFRVSEDGAVRWPEIIEIDPGKALALAPWREHIWISGLNTPLEEGDSFDLSLDFGEQGELAITVVVEPTGGH